jgi:hypothetical protein
VNTEFNQDIGVGPQLHAGSKMAANRSADRAEGHFHQSSPHGLVVPMRPVRELASRLIVVFVTA